MSGNSIGLGTFQNPSEPARLVHGERDEKMLESVLELDLGIHNEWPFLGICGCVLGISGEKGMTRRTTTEWPRTAAITSQTAFARDWTRGCEKEYRRREQLRLMYDMRRCIRACLHV